MKLFIAGRAGTRVCDWKSYALLRDNVQHFLEQGEPSWRFPALHALERAVDHGALTVDASRLRGEVLRAWGALWKIHVEDAAISPRTRSILTGNAEMPESRGTVAARHAGWDLPLLADAQTPIPRAASRFIRTVLTLTETAVDGDTLEIRCVNPGARRECARPVAGGRPERVLVAVRKRLLGAVASVGLLVASCGTASLANPRAPVLDRPPVDQVTQAPSTEKEAETPRLVAPPPAYGNKIVLAAEHGSGAES